MIASSSEKVLMSFISSLLRFAYCPAISIVFKKEYCLLVARDQQPVPIKPQGLFQGIKPFSRSSTIWSVAIW